jgi:aminobenzoyl-glutamate utilization protein B
LPIPARSGGSCVTPACRRPSKRTTSWWKYAASAWPQLVSKTIAEAIQKNIDAVGTPTWTEQEQQFARDFQKAAEKPVVGLRATPEAFGERRQATSSNDNGDVSWVVPAGLLNFPSSVPGIEYHEWKAAVTPVSSISHKGQVAGAKVLAASIIDLMTSPELLQKARAEFEVESKKTPYFSLLPPEAKPDLDLNRVEMEKYRADMRRFYLNKTPRFN